MSERLKNLLAWRTLVLALPALLALPLIAAEDDEDPTEASAVFVQLESPEQPVDVQAPPSQFLVPNGEEVWKRAWTRVTTQTPGQGAGRFSLSEILGSGIFKVAKNFRFEMFSPDDSGADLQVVIAAEEASQEGTHVVLKNMKMISFMGDKSPFMAQKQSDPAKVKKPDAAPQKTSFMPMGGRVEISAPHAVIDTETNEGRATGTVTIQIFQKTKEGKPERPVAVLSTERMKWRNWSEPTTGATEIAVYTAREGTETKDPLVQGYYEVEQPGQRPATMRLQGRGMVFESGTLDHVAPVYDDDGRLAGGSRISRNRAIFRSDISIEMNASSLSAFMPFQAPADAAKAPKAPANPQEIPEPSRTLVACNGPAILDMAVVPYTKRNPDANLAQPATAPVTKEQLLPVLLARRFEFLNNVTMLKVPLDAAGNPLANSAEGETRMSCGNLRIQLPAVQPQGGFGVAEYVEAIGGVRMKGRNTAGNITGAGAPGPAQDFAMNCERMYFDGPTGSMFLVGSPKNPASALNPQFEASALQFSYQMKTQDFAMPLKGPKRMVIRGGAPTPAKPGEKKDDGMLSFSQGDTVITWNGPLLRKLIRLPVPGGADRVKEVLTFTDNVAIAQSTGGLSMKAGHVKVVRPSPEGAVEYLEGIGGVDVKMGDQMIRGEKVAVEMLPGPNGKLSKDTITITGNRKKQLLATLIKGGSAARAEKFVIDRTTDTFMSLGGTVAVVKREGGEAEAPKPQAAVDAGGLFKGINLQQGGNMFIQSDGEFVKDGATNTIRIKKNVIVRQPGLQLLADEVELHMDNAADVGAPAQPAASGELFTADPKKIRCIGNIEVIASDSQWVQADELEYDVKTQRSTLKMADPQNDVRIYMRDEGGGTRVLCVRGSLELDGKSGTFKPGGQMMMLPFKKSAPPSRSVEDSPARGKAQKK